MSDTEVPSGKVTTGNELRVTSAAAIALWVIVVAGLAYGVIQTLSKVGALFG